MIAKSVARSWQIECQRVECCVPMVHLVGGCGWELTSIGRPHTSIAHLFNHHADVQTRGNFTGQEGQVTSVTPVTKFYTTVSSAKVKAKNISLGLVHGREGMESMISWQSAPEGMGGGCKDTSHGRGWLHTRYTIESRRILRNKTREKANHRDTIHEYV